MKNTGLTSADEKFCEVVAAGEATLVEAVKEAYPQYRKATKRAVEIRGNRLIKRSDIQSRVVELREKQSQRTEEKYAGLKEEMIDRIVAGIRAGTDGDKLTIVEFTRCIELLAKMNGWFAPTDVTIRNGGVAADYRPPTLFTMTDEEISAKLAEIRGAKADNKSKRREK